MASETSNRRKYARVSVPKGMCVGWKSLGKTSASRVQDMGLGGLYLHAENPASKGSTIELIFELPTGEIRARAIVCRSTPGRGMGVQFVQMKPEDRAKLIGYLSGREESSQSSSAVSGVDSRPGNSDSANSQLMISPRREEAAQFRFAREVARLMELTGKGTYYQLLGVTTESTRSQIKKNYYTLARKFHPDSHEGSRELIAQLVDLMAFITEAYKTVANEEKRAAYDKSLAVMGVFSMQREKTETAESVEEWFRRANECFRAQNFVGSVGWLRKCVAAAPKEASYRATLARSLSTIPQYHNDAVEHFQEAIDLDPWKEPVYLQFAELLLKMQLPSRARGVYSKLLEINPTHAEACEMLAVLDAGEKSGKSPKLISRLFGVRS